MLPTLLDPITLRAILAQETTILDFIGTVLADAEQYDEEEINHIRDHHAAVALANELACIHETDHPANQDLHSAATQLKAWHLQALDCWITAIFAEDPLSPA